jgi:hypothetical protein
MEKARIGAKKERKAIITECGLTSNAFSRGLERKSDPAASTAYRLARSVNKTIEELVDSESGCEYVRQLLRERGGVWEPPERIADIVADLMELDDDDLDIIRSAARTAAAKKGKEGTGTDGLPG